MRLDFAGSVQGHAHRAPRRRGRAAGSGSCRRAASATTRRTAARPTRARARRRSTQSLSVCASASASSRRSSTGRRNSTSSSTSRYGSISSTPRARNQSQTRSTSFSGADAPEVTPTTSTPSSHASSISVSSSIRCDGDAAGARDLDEAVRVRRVARADHEQQVDLAEHLLDRPLAVRGRVTDVFLLRRVDLGEAPAQRGDDLAGLVDRERRLRDVGEPRARREARALGVLDRLDEHDRVGRLAHRPDDLLVALVADQEHGVAVGGVAARLHVHLRHERAGRVDRVQLPRGRVRVHRRRDAVRGEDDRLALRHLGLLVDEDRAARLEVADDVQVVDDLLAHVDRRRRRARAPSRPSRRRARPRRSSRAATRGGPS